MEQIDTTLALELEKAWEDYEYVHSIVYNVIEELGWTIHEGRVKIKIDLLHNQEHEHALARTIERDQEAIEQAETTMNETRENIIWAAGEARRLKEEGKSPHTVLFWYAKTETLLEFLWSARDKGVAAIAHVERQVLRMQSEEVPCSSILEKRGRWTRVNLSARHW